jgi:hypothetical protein
LKIYFLGIMEKGFFFGGIGREGKMAEGKWATAEGKMAEGKIYICICLIMLINQPSPGHAMVVG